MCIHTAVLCENCSSDSSVDVNSILVGHTICTGNIGISIQEELADSVYRVVHIVLYMLVHMAESTINLALPTFQFPFF